MSDLALLQDLAVMTAIAGIAGLIFSKLRWPKVLGYILAGIIMGSNTWGGSYLLDAGSVQTLGQLGVIFLMFTLGLEFSASSMKKIGNVTLPTAIIDTVIMTWIGYTVGTRLFGWEKIPSLCLGAAICDSSTTLLAKIIDELKWSHRLFAKYVVGTSVCEDIICVGIIALITGVVGGSGMNLTAVAVSMGGLFVFFMATIVVGLILVPRLLTSVAKRGDDEALLLTLLGCCFFVTYLAFKLNYSIALGAFMMGIIGASSDVRKRLYELSLPLRTLFAAIFFVSIGLLVDPLVCLQNWLPILMLSLVVMGGKLVNCFLGGILTGESLKTSVQMAFGLAQIGEFAYMVALLYVTFTNDTTSPMYQIVVGVSLLTTILNPIMLRISDPIGNFVESRCPRKLKVVLDSYRSHIRRYRQTSRISEDRKRVGSYIRTLSVIAVLQFAIVSAIGALSAIDYSKFSVWFEKHDHFIFCLLANVIMLGFALVAHRVVRKLSLAASIVILGKSVSLRHAYPRQFIQLVIYGLVSLAFYLEWWMLNVNLLPREPWARWTIIGIALAIAFVGARFFTQAGHRAVLRLREALSAEERMAKKPKDVVITIPGGTVARFSLQPDSPSIGETVVTLNIRARTGASVSAVERNGKTMRNIGPDWIFAAGDVVEAMGTELQLIDLKNLLLIKP